MHKKIVPFFIVFMLSALSQASGNINSRIDSLKNVIAKNAAVPVVYNELAAAYTNYDTDSLKYYADKALQLSIQQNNKEQVAHSYLQLTTYYYYRGAYDIAYNYALKALEMAKNLNDNFILTSSHLRMARINILKQENKSAFENVTKASEYEKKVAAGIVKNQLDIMLCNAYTMVYAHLGLFDKSLEYGFKGLDMTEKVRTDFMKSELYNNIASTYGYMYNTEKAIEYQRKFIEQSLKNNEILNLQVAYVNIAGHLKRLEQYDSARHYLDKSRLILEYHPSVQRQAHLCREYGTLYHFQGKADSALFYLQQAVALYKQENLEPKLADCYYWIGDVYKDKGDYRQAEIYYTMSLEIHRKNGELSMVKDDYNALSVVEELKGNYKKSLEYAIMYMDLQDSLFNEKIANAVTAQEIKYETALKEARIAQQQAALQLGKQRQSWLLVGGSLALFAAAGLGWLYRRTRKQKEQIRQQHRRIELLNEDILHNSKNNLNLMTTIFERQATEVEKKDSAITSREIAFTLSALQHQLYEQYETNGNLKQYLQTLCRAKEAAFGVPVLLEYHCPENLNLSARMMQNMGLIFNELSTNAVKYAFEDIANPLITLTVSQPQPDLLKMVLKDNGKGLPPAFDSRHFSDGKGMGLVADLVAPKGNIKTYNDNGACFEITLPVN